MYVAPVAIGLHQPVVHSVERVAIPELTFPQLVVPRVTPAASAEPLSADARRTSPQTKRVVRKARRVVAGSPLAHPLSLGYLAQPVLKPVLRALPVTHNRLESQPATPTPKATTPATPAPTTQNTWGSPPPVVAGDDGSAPATTTAAQPEAAPAAQKTPVTGATRAPSDGAATDTDPIEVHNDDLAPASVPTAATPSPPPATDGASAEPAGGDATPVQAKSTEDAAGGAPAAAAASVVPPSEPAALPAVDVPAAPTAGDASPRGPPNVTATTGGTVTSADGNVTVEFPAASAPTDVTVTVTGASRPAAGLTLASSVYDFSAVDATGAAVEAFAQPVQLTIHFDPALGDAPTLYYLPSSGAPVPLATTIDPAAHTATAAISHFSSYAVGVSTATLVGKVADVHGQGLAGVAVSVQPTGVDPLTVTTDTTGAWQAEVPLGEVAVTVAATDAHGGATVTVSATAPQQYTADLTVAVARVTGPRATRAGTRSPASSSPASCTTAPARSFAPSATCPPAPTGGTRCRWIPVPSARARRSP